MIENLNNEQETSAEKTGATEVNRTVDFWRKRLPRLDKKIFEMIVFEQGLQGRDRLTKSQVEFYIDRRRNKKIG